MNSVEKSAKTYEEAVQAALADLNASISEVEVETLVEGSKGLLGLFGSRPYKVRVTLKQEETTDDLDLDSLLHGDRKKPAAKPAQAKPVQAKPAEAPAKQEAPAQPEKAAMPAPVKREKPAPKAEKSAASKA